MVQGTRQSTSIAERVASCREVIATGRVSGTTTTLPQFGLYHGTPLSVHRIADVRLTGVPAFAVTPKGEILAECSAYPDFPQPLRDRFPADSIAAHAERTLESDDYLLLRGIWDDQFWHWIMEYLPRVVVAEAAGFGGRYLIPPDVEFVPQSMQMLGVGPSRLVEYDGRHTHVSSLVLVDALEGFKGLPQYPRLVHTLRERLLATRRVPATASSPKRLYVARTNPARPRRIVNEHEVRPLLECYGFRTVHMEELGLAEQIGLASAAEAMVGPHGAGMVHALFMPQQSLVVECFSPHYILTSQVATLSLLGHRYYSIVGANGPLWEYQAGMDVDVDVTLLEATLHRELGGGRAA